MSLLTDRWEHTPTGLDQQELAWWAEFADVEERYCWVQTPALQRFLRGHYVQRIARELGPGSSVLELGCGTGWLCLLLAEYGIAHVCGVDFSPEQVNRALAGARLSGLSSRVEFFVQELGLDRPGAVLGARRFDGVIIHGVLHHLTCEEIRALFQDLASDPTTAAARIFILEPVLSGTSTAHSAGASLRGRLIDTLINLPMRGQRRGWRRVSAEERAVQEQIAKRNIGIHPRGPSPKELPFVPGEIEALTRPWLAVYRFHRVLGFSIHAAKNTLLLGLTYPRLARLLMWPYLRLVRAAERRMLADGPLPAPWVTFELLEGTLHCSAAAGR